MILKFSISLIAGFLSFFSPCVLPIVPGYISFISGVSLQKLTEEADEKVSKKIFLSSLFFTLGFSLVFVLLGASASFVGSFLRSHMPLLVKIAGIGIIILGLHMAGIFKISYLYKEKKIQRKFESPGIIASFLAGFFFAFGWTPCIGPVLAAILAFAAIEENFYVSIALLSFYALGLSIPFLLTSFFIKGFLNKFRSISKHLRKAEISLGIILIIAGVLIFFNKVYIISSKASFINLDKIIPESWAKKIVNKDKRDESYKNNKYSFKLKDINGGTINLEEIKGRVIIVNFWATWCSPCNYEMPELQSLYEKYQEKGVVIIGVAERSQPDEVKEFIKEKKISYLILLDSSEEVANKYGVFGLPKTFIFNSNIELITSFDGYVEREEIEKVILSNI